MHTREGNARVTVLIVDDNQISRMTMDQILKQNYHTLLADCGETALQLLQEHPNIALVLLDIYMPDMSGFEVLQWIKRDPRFSKIPVMMCTAWGDEENVIRSLDYGATDCIIKPSTPRVVLKRVTNAIEKEYLERQRLEVDLRTTTQRLDVLMDTLPGGIASFHYQDGELVPIYYNDAVIELMDMPREVCEQISLMEAVYVSDRDKLRDEIASAIAENRRIDSIFRFYRKGGGVTWIHMVAEKTIEEQGNTVLHAVFLDVSLEKSAELEAEQVARRFRYLAEHDSLTGINNRKSFCERTAQMLRKHPDQKYLLVVTDVERFKVINDLFGAEMGNRVLKTLAMQFASLMLGVGSYGRLGDDNFVLCYPVGAVTPEEILEKIDISLSVLNLGYHIKVCLGIYQIDDSKIPVEIMCDRARLALARIKGNYLESYSYYTEEMRNSLVWEQELCDEMESALMNNEFEVYVQPKYNLHTGKIVGGESLIRWNHSTKGMISPGGFIPLFEKNGAIVKLDAFVWEQTCRLLQRQKLEHGTVLPVSVNISRINFVNTNLTNHFSNLIRKYDLDIDDLQLEVTESMYVDDANLFYKELERLQDRGFKILMDDFGSGYSSFNMLKEAPVDILKLDLKFLSGSDKKQRTVKILTAIVNMAELINMPVIAEGVETAEQVQLLKDISCVMAQGYYYSRPVPTSQYEEMVRQQYESE